MVAPCDTMFSLEKLKLLCTPCLRFSMILCSSLLFSLDVFLTEWRQNVDEGASLNLSTTFGAEVGGCAQRLSWFRGDDDEVSHFSHPGGGIHPTTGYD